MTTQATKRMQLKHRQALINKVKSVVWGFSVLGSIVIIPVINNILQGV